MSFGGRIISTLELLIRNWKWKLTDFILREGKGAGIYICLLLVSELRVQNDLVQLCSICASPFGRYKGSVLGEQCPVSSCPFRFWSPRWSRLIELKRTFGLTFSAFPFVSYKGTFLRGGVSERYPPFRFRSSKRSHLIEYFQSYVLCFPLWRYKISVLREQ